MRALETVAALRACDAGRGLRGPGARTRGQEKRDRRGRGSAARATPSYGRNSWVVDTGASRHICPPALAGSLQSACGMTVDTANGPVRAAGQASVHIPALGRAVDAVVLRKAPRLLSAGLLVEQGYTLHWDRSRCYLQRPGGGCINLTVENGVPVLCADPAPLQHEREDSRRTSTAMAVTEGVEDERRQRGHYPWRGDCGARNEAAMRTAKHARRLPHVGVLAMDVA